MINQEKAEYYRMNAHPHSFIAAGAMYAIISNSFNGNFKRPISKSELHNLFEFVKNKDKMSVELDAVMSDGEKEFAKNSIDNKYSVLKGLMEDDLRARGLLIE